jgi:hypothetical protein
MNKLARSLLTLVAAGGLVVTAASSAMASGGGGGGGGGGNPDPGTSTTSCVRITLDPPQIIGASIRWTGTATNCSTGTERIVLKGADVTGSSTPGCTLAPLAYGLPSQSAGQTVSWFMTSKNQLCPGSHTEQFDAFADSSSAPATSRTITYVTT